MDEKEVKKVCREISATLKHSPVTIINRETNFVEMSAGDYWIDCELYVRQDRSGNYSKEFEFIHLFDMEGDSIPLDPISFVEISNAIFEGCSIGHENDDDHFQNDDDDWSDNRGDIIRNGY